MKFKVFSIFAIFAFVMGSLGVAAPAAASPPPPDYQPEDVGPRIRGWDASAERLNVGQLNLSADDVQANEEAAMAVVPSTPYDQCAVDAKYWLYLDDYYGGYGLTMYYLVAQTSSSELWVQANLGWPTGDPRTTPMVTCEQAAYLLIEFDGNMYTTETDFFGTPDMHDGSAATLPGLAGLPSDYYENAAGRQVVLVSNVRDDNYYNPDYPNYIAGFFSTTIETYTDRNVMSIDAYDWANRIGPDGGRPYLYEGVFAHEYQHLLHADYDPDEVNWVNEGLSDFAQFLVGYGHSDSHVADAAARPENSLVAWGDQGGLEILSDYGHAYMFMLYMAQQFGETVLQDLFLEPGNGISGADAVLAADGGTTFADLYHNYAAALFEKGSFGYGLEDFQVNVGHPGKPNPEAFATDGAPPWGTDYILLWGYERAKNLEFNGFQFNPTQWTTDGETLFGGSGDEVDNFLIADVDLTGVTGATLTFDTKFDIEYSWDYGFVQVSTDGGHTWTSLANADTCSDLASGAYPDIKTKVPGFTGVSGQGCNDPYDQAVYPTYPEAQWVNTSFDLSDYNDQHILVAFRYMTDWAYNESGWFVDNFNIDSEFTSDGSSTQDFYSLNEVLEIHNYYNIELIGERNRRGQSVFDSETILTSEDGVTGTWDAIKDLLDNSRRVVMLVTYDAPEGTSAYAPYSYKLISGGGNSFK